jgi:hypothetical protein
MVDDKRMASAKLEEVIEQVETLPLEEQLTLIADVAARVFRGEGYLVVERSGVPLTAVISMKDYEQYRLFVAQQLHRELGRKLGAEADRQGVDEEAFIASMEEDRQAVYAEMYGGKAKSK